MTLRNLHRPGLGLSIAKGEMFPLYLRRLRVVSKHNLSPTGVWMLPSRMGPVIEVLGGNVGSIEDVIQHNMLIPLASRFIPPDDLARIKSHFVDGPRGGLAAKVGMAGPRSGWAKHRLLRCPKCIKEDIGSCGRPFWRRDHLLPGSLFCGKHQMPLHMTCEMCMDYATNTERTLHAGYHCGCGLKALPETMRISDSDAEIEIEVARVASSLLEPDYLPKLNHVRVAEEIKLAATGLGLVSDGRLNWNIAEEYFMESPFLSIILRTDIPLERSRAFSEIMKGKRPIRHPISAIAMLESLNGSWNRVEERLETTGIHHVEEPRSPNVKSPRRPRRHYRFSPEIFTYYAERYSELHHAHPELCLADLLRLLPAGASRYLTEVSLSEAGYDVQNLYKSGIRDKKLSEELIFHIDERGAHLRNTGYRERINRQTLLRDFRRPNVLRQKGLAKRLSGVDEALNRNIETHAAWRKRIESLSAFRSAARRNSRRPRRPESSADNTSNQDH